jgi:glycosyltransferase involved in cell wall biosynthesis
MTKETNVAPGMELSIVIPCLNEVETVAICARKALCWLKLRAVEGEVIIADNGSTDGSIEAARAEGARIVNVSKKGYGNALMSGIASARGKYMIMGDADDSYDLSQLDVFIDQLRTGSELVQGCRLPRGGGTVMPSAMPPLHRWVGNPMFSLFARVWFNAPIHDVNCGMRGFTKKFYESLDMQFTGMEFAVEMVVKASLGKAKITEVPITLHPDGRKTRKPHLRTFRDGWRTLRFFLLYSPRWLFLIPGIAMMLVGLVTSLMLVPGAFFMGKIGFDIHTLFFSATLIIIGANATSVALLSRTFAAKAGLLPRNKAVEWIDRSFHLETGLAVATLMFLLGVAIAGLSFFLWSQTGFGELNSGRYLRLVVCSTTLLILGAQLGTTFFFLGLLHLKWDSTGAIAASSL